MGLPFTQRVRADQHRPGQRLKQALALPGFKRKIYRLSCPPQ